MAKKSGQVTRQVCKVTDQVIRNIAMTTAMTPWRATSGTVATIFSVAAIVHDQSVAAASHNQEQAKQSTKATKQKRPNILLLFPDQWRFDWDGYHQYEYPHLSLDIPNIRFLAESGVRFHHAFTPSPLCGPARACLASGREYDECGVPTNTANDFPSNIPTFYQMLRDEGGYHTMTVGKDDLTKSTHLGTNPPELGGNWTGLYRMHELGFSDGLRCEGKFGIVWNHTIHDQYGHMLTESYVKLKDGTIMSGWDAYQRCVKGRTDPPCAAEECPDRIYEDNWVTEKAIHLLHRTPADKPWFMQVNFPGPHPPFFITANMTRKVKDRIYARAADNPKSWDVQCSFNGLPQISYDGKCQYAAEIENIDRLIGKILKHLWTMRDRDTLICLSSDHGEMLGDHQTLGKVKPWQGSASVPLICTGPTLGVAVNKTIVEPVSTVDLAATFLDFAGIHGRKDKGMTSTSLKPFLMSQDYVLPTERSYRRVVYSGWQSWRMVVEVNTSLKFICCRGKCPGSPSTVPPLDGATGYMQLLYNISSDPFDINPLEDKEAVSRLRAQLPITPDFRCPGKEKARQGAVSVLLA